MDISSVGRRISQNLVIRGEQIPIIYGWFVANRFVVNRRYQRKLVWTIEEKRSFVDSLIHGYPVPLILLAEQKSVDGGVFEILDGMQRLNAITSFIQGEFDLDGSYFDLNTMVETKSLLDGGILNQVSPVLDRGVCTAFAKYTLALSIFAPDKAEEIDDVFRRINANGRILSQQDLRAAGATGRFATLARHIAETIRGDVSYGDILALNQMNKISITNSQLDYGIHVNEIFWVRNNVLRRDGVRESRDEELVADLLANMILPEMQASQTDVIHEYYGVGPNNPSVIFEQLEALVAQFGEEVLKNRFLRVYEIFRKVIADADRPLDQIMFNARRPNGFQRHFQVVFLAMSSFLYDQQKDVSDFKRLVKLLSGIGDHIEISGGGRWAVQEKEALVKAAKKRLSLAFKKKSVADPADEIWETKIETILRQSLTEQSAFDFKQGFCRLDKTRAFDDAAFAEAIKTATAIANLGPNTKGYLLVGISDKPEHAERFREITKSEPVIFAERFIGGIDSEAVATSGSLDRYYQRVVESIKRQPISVEFAGHLAERVHIPLYKGKTVIVFDVEPMGKAVLFDNQYWTRHGASTIKVEMEDVERLILKFNK
jgi:hypothetical protein